MRFVRIDETNKKDFSCVLPEILADSQGVSIGALLDGVISGAVSLTFDGEQYEIDWIYVTPSKRRMGVGSGLIAEVRTMLAVIGLCPVIMMINASNQRDLYSFALSLEDEDHPMNISYSHDRYVISTRDFANPAVLMKAFNGAVIMDYQTKPFWEMDEGSRKKMFSMISDNFPIYDEEQLFKTCEKELCLAAVKNGEPEAFALVQREDSGTLKLSYLYSKNPKALVDVLMGLSDMLQEGVIDPQRVFFEPITTEAELLAKRIFPRAKREAIYEIEL